MLREELNSYFKNGDKEYIYNKKTREVVIHHSDMYSCPNLEFVTLQKLSDLFGSSDIITDNDWMVRPGCDTCDYGSKYGYEIRIKNPTKNVEEYSTFALVVQ